MIPTAQPASELKPCPFCGGKADWDHDDCADGGNIYCTDCGVKVYESRNGLDERQKWNRRAEALAQDGWVRVPLLVPDEMEALRRFAETTEDDESYDVPEPMMSQLAMRGAVSRSPRRGRWYYLTDFGRTLLAAAPQESPK